MIKNKRFGIPVVLALGMVFLLASCADFFTTSWGAAAARDPSKITVSSSNIKALLKEAKGDKKASKDILDKIADKLAGNTDPASEPELRAAAVKAANQASGLGQLVLGELDTVLGDDPDEEALEALAEAIQEGAKGNDLGGIAADIVASLPTTTNANNEPVFDGDYIKNVSTSDLTLLAITLVLAEVGDADFETYINSWGASGKKIDGTGLPLTDSEKVIAAIANELATRDSEMGKMLKDLLKAN